MAGGTLEMDHVAGADMVVVEPGARDQAAATDCRGLAQIIDRIGDKWTVMVVGHLSAGPMRFTALMRAIPGVSHRMLTLTLRGLQRDGLARRTALATIPPRVDYELTGLGQSLTGPLAALAAWASANRPEIERARQDYAKGDAELSSSRRQ